MQRNTSGQPIWFFFANRYIIGEGKSVDHACIQLARVTAALSEKKKNRRERLCCSLPKLSTYKINFSVTTAEVTCKRRQERILFSARDLHVIRTDVTQANVNLLKN